MQTVLLAIIRSNALIRRIRMDAMSPWLRNLPNTSEWISGPECGSENSLQKKRRLRLRCRNWQSLTPTTDSALPHLSWLYEPNLERNKQ